MFQRRFPDIRVDFGLYDWTTAKSMISNRLADVGLITDAPEHEHWERIHIESARYVIYCRRDHPFAKRSKVSLSELEQEAVIIPGKGSLTRRLPDQACDRCSISLQRLASMNSHIADLVNFRCNCANFHFDDARSIFLRSSNLPETTYSAQSEPVSARRSAFNARLGGQTSCVSDIIAVYRAQRGDRIKVLLSDWSGPKAYPIGWTGRFLHMVLNRKETTSFRRKGPWNSQKLVKFHT